MNHSQTIRAAAAVFAVVAIMGVCELRAQPFRDAGSKIRGEYGASHQSASRTLYHARDYANDYRTYVQDARQSRRPVNAEVAKEHAEGLGHNIALFQKHLGEMRKHAASDKETLASLDLIDKYVKDAARFQAEMSEMCTKPEVNAAGSMKCCEDAGKSLDKAIAEHDKLMKKLAAKKPATK